MIFSDTEILRATKDQRISIDPLRCAQINPASYDVTLHPILRLTRKQDRAPDGQWTVPDVLDLWDLRSAPSYSEEHILYPEAPTYDIQPGEFLLASTQEVVKVGPTVVGRVEGKSSLARVGLVVHVTGGFIDPGFQGHITLEIANLMNRPLRLYSGMRIAQIAFSAVQGEVQNPYDSTTGHYQQQRGPTESRYVLDGSPSKISFCLTCDWKGVYTDWEQDSGESRFCPGCQGYQRACPSGHCLECGAST